LIWILHGSGQIDLIHETWDGVAWCGAGRQDAGAGRGGIKWLEATPTTGMKGRVESVVSRRCNHAGVGQSAEGAIVGNNAGRRAAFCRSSPRTPAVGVADHCAMPWLPASDAGYRGDLPETPTSSIACYRPRLLCSARVGASGQAALLIPRFRADEQSGLTSPMH
jgi:hypothetical protein